MARRVGVGTGSYANGVGDQVAKQWHAIAYPQEIPATAHAEHREKVIRTSGIKVFGPKTT